MDAHAESEFRASIAPGWNRRAVEQVVEGIPGVRRQASAFLNPCKSSWCWPAATLGDVAHLESQLKKRGLEVTLSYTGGVFLDIIPRNAGKGNALAWLCRRIAVPLETVVVAGASGTNSGTFALPGVRGILVSNASRELFAGTSHFRPWIVHKKLADGVLAGLEHFGVLASVGDMATHA